MTDTVPFRVLILGDGNFSFSLALCRILWPRSTDHTVSNKNAHVAHAYLGLPFPSHSRHNVEITATSFDDRQELLKKYPESRDILIALESEKLKAEGVQVLHGINAWELQNHFGKERKFDAVVWNHPHLGTEDFRLHRFLMAHFFQSVASVLSPGSSCVCVSLVEGQETRWDIVGQAMRSNLGLQQIALFDERLWPGYVVKRNKHGGSFKNMHTKKHTQSDMKSHLFRFGFGAAKVQWEGLDSTPIDRILTANREAEVLADTARIGYSSDESEDIPQRVPAASLTTSPSPSVLPITSTPCSPAATKPTRSTRKSRRLAAIPSDLICPHCSKQLASSRGWSQHVHMIHNLEKFGSDWTPTRERTMRCSHEGCDKTFADEQDKWQHEINKHTTVTSEELPSAVVQLGSGDGSAAGDDYDYVPCDTCGQAVVKRDWGMILHLESLKPAIGLDMRCPLCESKQVGKGALGFIETRALFQHYKFCRLKNSGNAAHIERGTKAKVDTCI